MILLLFREAVDPSTTPFDTLRQAQGSAQGSAQGEMPEVMGVLYGTMNGVLCSVCGKRKTWKEDANSGQ